MECTKADWKLFRNRIPEWQEAYMEKLNKEYIEILSRESSASDNFWELEKRIRNDKKSPGVIITLSKQNMVSDLIALINQEVIGFENLEGFSDEIKEIVKHFIDRA